MKWTYWLFEFPAKAIQVWLTAYWVVLTLICVGILATGMLSLTLGAFGIQWGW